MSDEEQSARQKLELRELIRGISIENRRYMEVVARSMGLAASDVEAVGVLQRNPDGISAQRLASAVGLSPAATSALIKRMTRVNHATRLTAADDSRKAVIKPTATALAESRSRFSGLNRAINAVVDRHSLGELETTLDILRDVLIAMRSSTAELHDQPSDRDAAGPDQGPRPGDAPNPGPGGQAHRLGDTKAAVSGS